MAHAGELAAEPATGRQAAMADFLRGSGWPGIAPVSLAGDASFRRYYRLVDGARRTVLMDAPPPFEDVRPYVAVAAMLRELGLSAPQIHAEDPAQGFLLIEDFGDDRYTTLLDGAVGEGANGAARGADETALYALAVDTLVALHRAVAASGLPALPPYDETRLIAEAALLVDWYAPSVLGAPLPAAAREDYLRRWRDVLPRAVLPVTTLVLRDYHVDNLMLLRGRPDVQACGLLDFQDAVLGPASYDLVSLLEDARRDVPAALRTAMTERYLAAFPGLDRAGFVRSGAILAAQRNAKILGIFTRLWRRDGKPAYLAHINRVWRLLEADLRRESALTPIGEWLDRYLPPPIRRPPVPPRARDRREASAR
jgi:aminoglycoside/choline kinase family phosphotransferase